MSHSPSEEPRIIVDDDWKSQVEREKQEQRAKEVLGNSSPRLGEQEFRLPPANLVGMIHMLGSQAMTALGLLPSADSETPQVNRPLAKFLIDMLGVLESKTEGNRTEEESNELRNALHHLRMIFVSLPATSPAVPEKKSPLELP